MLMCKENVISIPRDRGIDYASDIEDARRDMFSFPELVEGFIIKGEEIHVMFYNIKISYIIGIINNKFVSLLNKSNVKVKSWNIDSELNINFKFNIEA